MKVKILFLIALLSICSISSFNQSKKSEQNLHSKINGDESQKKVLEYTFSNCEVEMAKLDNYAINLQNTPKKIGYIIVYGSSDGSLEEIKSRIFYIRKYLTKNRFIPDNRIVVVHGGFRNKISVELWITTSLDEIPLSTPNAIRKKLKSKSKNVERNYDCSELY
jgi:hypothetical protein